MQTELEIIGIASDFRNSFNPIKGYFDLLIEEIEDGQEPDPKGVRMVKSGVKTYEEYFREHWSQYYEEIIGQSNKVRVRKINSVVALLNTFMRDVIDGKQKYDAHKFNRLVAGFEALTSKSLGWFERARK